MQFETMPKLAVPGSKHWLKTSSRQATECCDQVGWKRFSSRFSAVSIFRSDNRCIVHEKCLSFLFGLVGWRIAWEWEPDWAARGWKRAQMWTSAEEHLERAITTFRSIGHEHQVQKHKALLAKLVAERNAAGDQDANA
jgi:hypothetical protein